MIRYDGSELEAYRRYAAGVYGALHAADFGQPFGFDEPALSPDGSRLVVTASVLDDFAGLGRTELWCVDLRSGAQQRISRPGAKDRLGQWSPCGRWLAYLSTIDGIERLVITPAGEPNAGVAASITAGTIEYYAWSPSGDTILFGLAAPGAELAGMQGARRTPVAARDLPPWLPATTSESRTHLWRALWILALDTRESRQLSPSGLNIWDAVWCGAERIGAVASDDPLEAAWYGSRIVLLAVDGAAPQTVLQPELQVGSMAGSSDGRWLALVEGLASDRLVVAGGIRVLNLQNGRCESAPTPGVDVTSLRARDTRRRTFAGHQQFATVVGELDLTTGSSVELHRSETHHGGFWMPLALPYGTDQALALTQNFASTSTVTLLGRAGTRAIAAPRHGGAERVGSQIGEVRQLRWQAPDGLEVQGWLVEPRAHGPFPIATEIHGGPVWMNRNSWLGNMPMLLTLLQAGYAIFLPNPRGSWGRGRDYVARVFGDIGGAEVGDLLSGFDHLVASGRADPKRLCITGSSHGGYMTSLLVTRDRRFAAAVSRCPVCDWHTQHRTSNIPHFDDLFLGGRAIDGNPLHMERSPVFAARRATTPTLLLCGLLDRCTPPSQAREMYAALAEAGVPTGLVTYPLEGHGLRAYPVRIDVTARILAWFDRGAGIERALSSQYPPPR
jgi:dipeptidyl aminopeptidase/acylaminoacyl peptidase